MFSRAFYRLTVFPRSEPVVCFHFLGFLYFFYSHQTLLHEYVVFLFSRSEGGTTINIIDPAFESKIRAKVADVFKDIDVNEHYKMIEQVLEDEKMVSLI